MSSNGRLSANMFWTIIFRKQYTPAFDIVIVSKPENHLFEYKKICDNLQSVKSSERRHVLVCKKCVPNIISNSFYFL